MKKYPLLILVLVLNALPALAQEAEMADVMRSNGKIYAVVAVCVTILLGLVFYLWRLDGRISRLEKKK